MSIKIIFSDIDGTLLNDERQVSEYTIEQVKKIKNQIPFVLVSARMPKQMYYIQECLGILNEPLIAYNGALVKHKQKILHSTEIPLSMIEMLIQYNEQKADNQIHISLYNADEWYAPSYDFWAKREENNTQTPPEILSNKEVLNKWRAEGKGAHKVMLMGEVSYIEPMFAYLDKNLSANTHFYRAKETYIEVADIQVSKLTGVKTILDKIYPFSLSEVMAFGDNFNDIEMLKNVGHGVAVANAHTSVKAVCKAITKHHKEEGVADYISAYFKK